MKIPFLVTVIAILLSGCATTPPNAEFVGSVSFSPLETFSYKHTLISGMDFRDSEEYLIEELSEAVIARELTARDFEQVESGSDFYAVVKWKKAVSSYPPIHDSIDGASAALSRRDNPSYRFASRLHLTLEIYESGTNNLFWRKDMPNIFDALQLTEGRLEESLSLAIKNFPTRVEKDPNLPSLE
jgi:hypothetical protein